MATVPNKRRRRSTLRQMRTATSAHIRSKPMIEGQRYLDLYVLQRDRFRWQGLIQRAERSIESIDLALQKMGFDPDDGQERSEDEPPARAGGKASGETRKTNTEKTKVA